MSDINNGLIVRKSTSADLYAIEEPYINEYKERGVRNPSLTLYGSMVDGFASHLPYSMDIEQEEYVPGDFLNLEPFDVEENNWFKWEDRRTIYNAMYRWSDTRRSGILLQTCYVFQQMLLGNISPDIIIDEDKYYELGIHKFTYDEEYNRRFFETLKKLPDYYKRVMYSTSKEERRKNLEEVYKDICANVQNLVGGFRETDGKGNIVRESKADIAWPAWRDVEMIVDANYNTIYDGLKLGLTKEIKNKQLDNMQKKRLD